MRETDVRVIGLNGSPKKTGNTGKLLSSCLAGAEEAGGIVTKVHLGDLKGVSCLGCNACHTLGRCIREDDITELFKEILAADLVIVASPIYSMSVTSELKTVIDRAHYLWAMKFRTYTLTFSEEHLQTHKGIFLSTAGMADPEVFKHSLPIITAFFNGIGVEYSANLLFEDMDTYGGIEKHPGALEQVYAAGKETVFAIRREKDNLR